MSCSRSSARCTGRRTTSISTSRTSSAVSRRAALRQGKRWHQACRTSRVRYGPTCSKTLPTTLCIPVHLVGQGQHPVFAQLVVHMKALTCRSTLLCPVQSTVTRQPCSRQRSRCAMPSKLPPHRQRMLVSTNVTLSVSLVHSSHQLQAGTDSSSKAVEEEDIVHGTLVQYQVVPEVKAVQVLHLNL